MHLHLIWEYIDILYANRYILNSNTITSLNHISNQDDLKESLTNIILRNNHYKYLYRYIRSMSQTNAVIIPDEVVMSKIYMIRNHKVMLDRDLAELYGVETKVLKQAVRRNITRFPEDFMFEMTKDELENWRSQFVTSKEDRQGLRYMPFCFTEQGVTMLSCVLSSERAIHVNIQIIRIYTRIRELVLLHKDVLLLVEQVEKKLLKQDQKIEILFTYLSKFIEKEEQPRAEIGFKRKGK